MGRCTIRSIFAINATRHSRQCYSQALISTWSVHGPWSSRVYVVVDLAKGRSTILTINCCFQIWLFCFKSNTTNAAELVHISLSRADRTLGRAGGFISVAVNSFYRLATTCMNVGDFRFRIAAPISIRRSMHPYLGTYARRLTTACEVAVVECLSGTPLHSLPAMADNL
jgi:hypothetical protein